MAENSEQRRGWRTRLGWLAGELIVVFAGVSGAFVIENYRDSRNQAVEFHQALSGVIAELSRHETRGHGYADSISAKIKEWEETDRRGQRAIPGYYRIPGATHPPIAAWNTMVSSGLVRLIEPKLRTELGYFYSEFTGIHDNYERTTSLPSAKCCRGSRPGRMRSTGRTDASCQCSGFIWTCRKSLPMICGS